MIKNKTKKNILISLSLFTACLAHGQQNANTTGGEATGSGGTVAYSLGQVIYTTNSGNNGNVVQGVQQSYEIFTVGAKEIDLNIKLIAYPNPTSDNLTLQISDFNNEKLSYQMFDTQGKLLSNGQISAEQTQINMNNLLPSTYFIYVVNQENKKVQSFKIIKN